MTPSDGCVVEGNLIGTDSTGTGALGNTYIGVLVYDGASGNVIGGTVAGAGNVISGNGGENSGVGVYIYGSTTENNEIAGNRIGTNSAGTSSLGNGLWGVILDQAPDNLVGGTTSASRNIVSGNGQGGVAIYGGSAVDDVVEGNFIGVDVTGTQGLGNAFSGVYVGSGSGFSDDSPGSASDATIGGTAAGAGNVISANGNFGVWISGAGASGIVVQGNYIGTDVTGTLPLGNALDGVRIDSGASNNTIGGTAAGAGNVIAFNGSNGITVGESATDASTGDAILENAIFGNTKLGIDLGNDGVTLNDSSGHSGPNLFQDFPVLSSAFFANGSTTITGTLSASPNTTYRVEFFSNVVADQTGYGQGQTFLTFANVTTDGSGAASFSVQTPNAVAAVLFISATATDPNGNTSEFSADIVNSPGTFTSVAWTGGGGDNEWNDPANWSDDQVPGAGEDVSINLPGSFTIVYSSGAGDSTIHSLTGSDDLSITGGSLTVSTSSSLSGQLSIAGGSLTLGSNSAISGDVSVTQDGTLNISGSDNTISGNVGLGTSGSGSGAISVSGPSNTITGSLMVQAGSLTISGAEASLTISGALTFPGSNNGEQLSVEDGATFTASGPVTLSGGSFSASTGGTLSLPGLTSITDSFGLSFTADGAGSLIDLSNLTGFAGANEFGEGSGSLAVTNGATILDASLTTLNGVSVTLDGTGTLATSQWTTLTNGGIAVEGGSYNDTNPSDPNSFANLTDIDNSSLYLDGGSLTLPAVTSYTNNLPFEVSFETSFLAQGAASILNMPALASINQQLEIEAYSNGQIDLPALTSYNIQFNSQLSDTTGASIELNSSLTTLNNLTLTVDGTGSLPLAQFTSITNCQINVEGGTYTLPTLTDIDGSSVEVTGGGKLTLPAVTSLVGGSDFLTLEAFSTGSTLSLPGLISLDASNSELNIDAILGGQVLLPSLAEITVALPNVTIESENSGSVIDLSALTSFPVASRTAYLIATQGGSLIDPQLTSFVALTIITDPTATLTVPSYDTFSFHGGSSAIQTGTLDVEGDLSVQENETLNIQAGVTINGSGVLSSSAGTTVDVSGNLLGDTQNASDFAPLGTVVFDGGAGTSNPPQELEAMSADLGAVQAGYNDNFAYGTISLTANTYVQLVDQSHNSSGTGPEAVYADGLILAAGATLDLNGLHLYVRGTQIASTAQILNGTVTQLPSGGPIEPGTPTAGGLVSAGQVDDWTFSGQAGGSVTIVVNPGSGGSPPAFSPQLGWVSVEVLDPNGNVLASATNTGSGSGSIVQLSDVALTATGTYTIQIQAPPSESSSTGNYVITIVAAPDLVVSNIVNPAIGETDQPVKISWTDSNQGGADVTNGWDDEVFASPDGQLDDAVLLGDFPEEGTLAAGTSVNIANR